MFDTLPLLPADPILGLSAAYREDPNPNKVDLGVGVYKTERGQTPVLASVAEAEAQLLGEQTTKAYTSPAGIAGANRAAAELALGTGHPALTDRRTATIQTPGGCGALRVAAELIAKAKPGARVWVSAPTWANHVPLLGSAGLTLKEYPYYDFDRHSLNFDAMVETLKQASADDVVLLHACCHNPSGADLSEPQWQTIATMARDQGFTPFIDMAYQGFGRGVDEDAYGVRLMAEQLPQLLVATSFSKNLGLYRERAGSLTIIGDTEGRAQALLTQVLSIARGLYSMPPSHGAAIVDRVYGDETLRRQWLAELGQMRERIHSLRHALVDALNRRQSARDFSFIAQESGMFSFLGLSVDQVQRLRSEFSVYMTDNSRINIAGVNADNLDYLADAVCSVIA